MSDGEERVRDAGYDDLVDALAAGEGYYLECSEGHGSLPPRLACPQCGDRDLAEAALPETGVVDFGAVRLTGQVRAAAEDVDVGTEVAASVGETATTGDRLVTFELR